MPPTINAKADDDAVKAQREKTAQRVIEQFGNQLPDRRLLCFFDDNDCQALKDCLGVANRGFYAPVKETELWPEWPNYLTDLILGDDSASSWTCAFDHLIYLHGSTCTNEIGLTMTFAHELQHFVQNANVPKLRAENLLVSNLSKDTIKLLGLKWSDVPIEREARIVSKRIARNLFGPDPVRQFIDEKIAEGLTASDAADWRFVQEIETSSPVPYDVATETRHLFRRLQGCRPEFEKLLREPCFKDLDLDSLLDDARK
jgi:hypothetical protein